MLNEKIKNFFAFDRHSPVEREVRRRLTWRVIMLSISPLPFLLVLIYFIHFLAMSNHESICDLYESDVNLAKRLKCLEEKVRQIQEEFGCDGRGLQAK